MERIILEYSASRPLWDINRRRISVFDSGSNLESAAVVLEAAPDRHQKAVAVGDVGMSGDVLAKESRLAAYDAVDRKLAAAEEVVLLQTVDLLKSNKQKR